MGEEDLHAGREKLEIVLVGTPVTKAMQRNDRVSRSCLLDQRGRTELIGDIIQMVNFLLARGDGIEPVPRERRTSKQRDKVERISR